MAACFPSFIITVHFNKACKMVWGWVQWPTEVKGNCTRSSRKIPTAFHTLPCNILSTMLVLFPTNKQSSLQQTKPFSFCTLWSNHINQFKLLPCKSCCGWTCSYKAIKRLGNWTIQHDPCNTGTKDTLLPKKVCYAHDHQELDGHKVQLTDH